MLIGKKAPYFKAKAVVNGKDIVEDFSLDQYIGKKYVIFSFTREILPLFALQKSEHFKAN